jgi:ribonuclease P protein component
VQHTLRKSEILRGYSVFSDILKNGESIHSSTLQCYVTKKKTEKNAPAVRVGFAIPRRDVPLAVERNKLKRFMREAFRANKELLHEAASIAELQLALVFIFRNRRGANVRRIRYASIENDVKDVMSKIISMMMRLQ